jgi:hypothetical protein
MLVMMMCNMITLDQLKERSRDLLRWEPHDQERKAHTTSRVDKNRQILTNIGEK